MRIPVGRELILATSRASLPEWIAYPSAGYLIGGASNVISVGEGMRLAYLEATGQLVREKPGAHYYMGEYGETGVVPQVNYAAGMAIEDFFYVKKEVVTETFAGEPSRVMQLYDVWVKVGYPQEERWY